MRNIWIISLIAAAAGGAQQPEPDIVVFLHSGSVNPRLIDLAQSQATAMLATAGITVEWRSGNADYRGYAEVIEIAFTDPREDFKPGALASAHLETRLGTRIEVFYNRIRGQRSNVEVVPILAHVLVHEITHILEGTERHSRTGVMKADWNDDDYRQMRRAPLPFAEEDLRLIHAWEKGHTRILLAAAR